MDVRFRGFDPHTLLGYFTTSLLAMGVLACSLVDDDEPPPMNDTGDQSGEVCIEQLQNQCLPGMFSETVAEGGGGSVIHIDDPGASVGVGPGAWLVQVGSAADYIASYQLDGTSCSVYCGWCQRGESLCHQGFNENGYPLGCQVCVPYGPPDLLEQCAVFIATCTGLDETGSESEDDGVDETGADSGAMEVADAEGFDCGDWDIGDAVVVDGQGGVIVDAAIVELAAAHLGEPLAKCDGTRFRERSDGYFEVSALTATGLLGRVGLERGDVILSVDGEPMRGADQVLSKAMGLFMGGRPALAFRMVVLRGTKTIPKVVRIR